MASSGKVDSNLKLRLIFIALFALGNTVSGISLEAQSVAEANAEFANSAFNLLEQAATGQNFVFSPYVLSLGIWMLASGARGSTREEIKSGLKLNDLDEGTIATGFSHILETFHQRTANSSVRVSLNNRFFISKIFDLKYDFVSNLQETWHSDVKSVNFTETDETVSVIGKWVQTTSNSKLKSLFETENLEDDLSSVLVGVANIGGAWKTRFAHTSLREKPFFVNENDRVKVQMMMSEDNFRTGDITELDSSAIMLPLQDDRFGLVVLLPNRRTGLSRVVEKLRTFGFAKIIGKMKRRWVELSFPKFKIESTFDFVRSGLLSKLGIRSLLYETGDLTGISCQTGLYLSQVLQTSLIEVNEEGMEGSPPTFRKINSLRPMPVQPVRFYVDHPFLMFVYDQWTRSILLVAQKVI